jgi:hypothetical protein
VVLWAHSGQCIRGIEKWLGATEPSPSPAAYPSPNPFYLGNALSNLVSNYQQAQQGQQATQQNNLRLQQDQQLLDQSKAFAGGLPTNPDGTPNYSAIMKTLAEKGDVNAISQFAPILQQQQNLQGANAPDPILGGGGGTSGGSTSRTADAIPSDGSTADTLADNLATRIESKGQSDPYDVEGPVTKSGDRAYGKYQVMGDNIPSWTKEILGVEMTPGEFLADPKAQDEVARAKLGQYIKQTGSPQDAASMWLTGKPLAQGANIADQNGMTGARYAATVTQGMAPGGGTQVASAGDSDAPAYASPDKPAIPPVSAAAGSSIPRGNASTAAAAVGGLAYERPSATGRQQSGMGWHQCLPSGRAVRRSLTDVSGSGATGSCAPLSGVCGVDRLSGWRTAADSGQHCKGCWRCARRPADAGTGAASQALCQELRPEDRTAAADCGGGPASGLRRSRAASGERASRPSDPASGWLHRPDGGSPGDQSGHQPLRQVHRWTGRRSRARENPQS